MGREKSVPTICGSTIGEESVICSVAQGALNKQEGEYKTRALATLMNKAYTLSTRTDGHCERSELPWLNKHSFNAHEHVN